MNTNRFSTMWASAFILAGLCLFQLARLAGMAGASSADAVSLVMATQPLFSNPARAGGGMVTSAGGYTILSANMDNEDMLFVLDSRNEQILAYKIEGQTAVQLKDRQGLPALFASGRSRNQGRP